MKTYPGYPEILNKSNSNTYFMKNSTGKFISKLITALPIAAFFRKERETEKERSWRNGPGQYTQEENLNRIFMVRYRIQHL